MDKVLVSGASGFIGRALCQYLVSRSFEVHGIVRKRHVAIENVNLINLDLEKSENIHVACEGVDCVVHLAGRAHVLNDDARDPLEVFRRVNVHASLRLARAAIKSRVRRFVFVSSVGVNGAESSLYPFAEYSEPMPHADYAISKFEAEEELKSLFSGAETELVIIRPPLVYAADAPGNFSRLLRVVATGFPLPFGSLNNQRSIVSLENLIAFISLCIEHPAAKNELFLVSDGSDVSTTDIVRLLSRGMGKKSILIPVPDVLLKMGAKLLGKKSLYIQLCRSLQIDSSKAETLLGWKPLLGAEEALVETGKRFINKNTLS
ncbi:hypothetical protein Mag101_07595 [Microbulbifer agarilyticus]|uniref:NAD-dependent epimerase/dehydratase domain-containing protein n=1 Tax=Microbulbifer agarilyticus TaxID=260552 RepID=A0A1Q2M4D1_9GAMM|nr:NAD-dependent epimerase/dehydratase family protein [Microbulbifer agarilyticus]AQQ67516.1 hypothetical protein Mag101_07595 [Microbulbifer agarilyticus]